ncbi:hypothetical protein CL649_04470 [bacterium]|nr:hypothetical protein [bacterium]|tara:strand:- start:266 stop:790 length:525 start_codon:yes stop_codon:yes gene_type:complete
MTKQPSWQKRQVDSFGKFRIEYGAPTNQMTGQRVYTLMAEGTGGNSKLGMRDDGNYDIQVDQTITIAGGTKGTPPRDGNGVVITSVEGGISITCQKGKLSLVAEEIELVSGKDIWCSALGGQMVINSKKCHFKVKDLDVDMGMFRGNNIPGDVVVRDAGFLAKVCAGTEVNFQQ